MFQEYKKDTIWLKEYPVRYVGTQFNGRMTIVRLACGGLFIHSPCEIDVLTKQAIETLGEVKFIVAPGSYHYFNIESAQRAFPEAETFICPGIETKLPRLKFDYLLGDKADTRWSDDFDQLLIRGNRVITEVTFYHKPSGTLILVDLIENITDKSQGINWSLKLWWKLVFRMWNNPKPAPEYQFGWKDKQAAARSLNHILEWDFDSIILSHGDIINENAKSIARQAWHKPLKNS